MSEMKHPRLLKAAQIKVQEQTFHHPWNKKSAITGVMLGRTLGLVRTGVNIGRVPPGKESFVYHLHHREEEWIYVLAGKGYRRDR